jgi:hypothetical protein
MYPGSKQAQIKRPALNEKPRPTVLKKAVSLQDWISCQVFSHTFVPFIFITG